jgi:hypothetical protein
MHRITEFILFMLGSQAVRLNVFSTLCLKNFNLNGLSIVFQN